MDDEIMMTDADGEPVPANQRYQARVTLEPDEVRDAFAGDESVEWFPNADPPAFGMPGKPPFEAWPTGRNSFVVRSQVPASIQLASPYVLVETKPLEGGGSLVRARFVRRPPGVLLSKGVRTLLAVTCVGTLLLVLAYVVILPLMLFNPNMWVIFVGSIAGLVILSRYSKNRPTEESMTHYGTPLWALIGRLLVPHALGDGEDPFRLKALGARSR